jgi:recombination protein RecR
MSFSPLIQELFNALRCLPGVGPKSSQRMALHLLQHDRPGALALVKTLTENIQRVGHCKRCKTLSENTLCHLCKNEKRNQSLLCIVASPADIIAIEQTASFKGIYFVLSGLLSPIDGIGPDEIGISHIKERLQHENIDEIILALNPTVEGQTTEHFITHIAKTLKINISRLAHGIPLGGELEYTDNNTLAHALIDRKPLLTEDP